MPTATINGTELFYAEHGSGPPCLVLHGGPGLDHTYFRPWLDGLGDALRLLYVDLRGHGRSGRPPDETLTHAQFAADLDALRAHLGLEAVALLGHSFGGYCALEYARRYPGRASRLILVDTAPALDYDEEIRANIRRKEEPPGLREVDAAGPPADEAAFARRLQVRAPLYYYHYDSAVAAGLSCDMILSRAAARRGPALRREYDVLPHLAAITAPALVLAGRDDFICPPSQARRLADGLPGATLHIFEESGHFPFVEEPQAFDRVVRGWLARLG